MKLNFGELVTAALCVMMRCAPHEGEIGIEIEDIVYFESYTFIPVFQVSDYRKAPYVTTT